MNSNFTEVLRVVIAVVLVVLLIDVMSMLFLTFTGATTSIWIWIFAVPSKTVDESSTSQQGSAQANVRWLGQRHWG